MLRSAVGPDPGAPAIHTIPELPAGTPVLDPRRDVAELRGELGRHAHVLGLGQGPLHVDGAHVHREVARYLGQPLATAQARDGASTILHGLAQVGRSEGYPTERTARIAGSRLLATGVGAGRGGAIVTVPVEAGETRRMALVAVERPPASTSSVQPLRYEREHAAEVPASGIVFDVEAGWRTLDGAGAQLSPNAFTTVPDRVLDELSVVSRDPHRSTLERRVEQLAEHGRDVGVDGHAIDHARDPAAALAARRALETMRRLDITAAAGWERGAIEAMHGALVRTGRSLDEAEDVLRRVREPLRNVVSSPKNAVSYPIGSSELQRLLVAAVGRPEPPSDLLETVVNLRATLQEDVERASNIGQRVTTISAYRASLVAAFEALLASARPRSELVAIVEASRRASGVASDGGAELQDGYGRLLLAAARSSQTPTEIMELTELVIARAGLDPPARVELLVRSVTAGARAGDLAGALRTTDATGFVTGPGLVDPTVALLEARLVVGR